MSYVPHAFQEIRSLYCIMLWIDPNSSMAEIERFVGIMGVFHAQGGTDPLRFTLTPKRAIKARLFYHANITVVRPLPHPRFTHPTRTRFLRYSQAMELAKTLCGIPEGKKLTTRTTFAGLSTKG